MKKILLASTALIVSAGFASAEVVIGGDGYMGVAYGNLKDGIFATTDTGATETAPGSGEYVSEYSFVYDLDVDFKVSGTSDSGLTFGASGDFDDLGKSQGARGFDNSIFISGDFGTITMGDVNGAAEQVIGDLSGVGLTGLGDFNENIFLLGAGAQPAGPLARYDYSVSGITLSLGLSDDSGYAIGAGYGTDLFNVGLAYESVADGASVKLFDIDALGSSGRSTLTVTAPNGASQIIGAASVTFSGVTLKGVYGQVDVDGTQVDQGDQYGVSASAGFGAATVKAYYRAVEVDYKAASNIKDNKLQAYGLGVEYDLGGGLALEAGVAQAEQDYLVGTNNSDTETLTVADFGISINF